MLSCFLSDDSLAVFEPVRKNTGIVGGKYLERGQVRIPGMPVPQVASESCATSKKALDSLSLSLQIGFTKQL